MAINLSRAARPIVVFLLAIIGLGPVFAENPSSFLSPPLAPHDTIDIWLSDCASKGKFCDDKPLAQTLKLNVYDNGELGKIQFAGCAFDSVMAYTVSNLFGQGTLGPYLLNSWYVDGVMHSDTFQTVPDLVALMNQWDTLGNWVWNPAQLLISGGHPGSAYTMMDVTVLLFNTPSMVGFNLGFDPKGTEYQFERGFHEVVLEDTLTNSRDTFFVHVACSERLEYAIQLGDTIEHCYDLSDILTGPASVVNACEVPGGSVNFTLTASGLCIRAIGDEYGLEQSCFVVCDSTGFCDTTYLDVRVLFPSVTNYVNNEIPLGSSHVYAFDTTRLNAAVDLFTFTFPPTQAHTEFTIDPINYAVNYYGKYIGGIDTACAVICDAIGTCDTTWFYIKVRASNAVIYDTLLVGETGSWCANPTLFIGDMIAVTNICQNMQGQSATFDIDPVSLCVEISGLQTGTDTACLVICDEHGACDSIQLIITVEEKPVPVPPMANPDQAVSLLDAPVVISVLANDVIPSPSLPVLVEILPANGLFGPFNGTAIVDSATNRITYTANMGFCDGTDLFMYRVCQDGVCDSAMVTVTVDCAADTSTTLVFYNGISPNGDGTNDTFIIENSEKYPDNELQIFNRWGNQVFFEKNYRGNFEGYWDGNRLPDGVYFYQFKDGFGNAHNDYLMIKR